MEGTYVYLWLIHVDVQQKPTQHCKAIILQLKKNSIDFQEGKKVKNQDKKKKKKMESENPTTQQHQFI